MWYRWKDESDLFQTITSIGSDHPQWKEPVQFATLDNHSVYLAWESLASDFPILLEPHSRKRGPKKELIRSFSNSFSCFSKLRSIKSAAKISGPVFLRILLEKLESVSQLLKLLRLDLIELPFWFLREDLSCEVEFGLEVKIEPSKYHYILEKMLDYSPKAIFTNSSSGIWMHVGIQHVWADDVRFSFGDCEVGVTGVWRWCPPVERYSLDRLLPLLDQSPSQVAGGIRHTIAVHFGEKSRRSGQSAVGYLIPQGINGLIEFVCTRSENDLRSLQILSSSDPNGGIILRVLSGQMIANPHWVAFERMYGWRGVWIQQGQGIQPSLRVQFLRETCERPGEVGLLHYQRTAGWKLVQTLEANFENLLSQVEYQVTEKPLNLIPKSPESLFQCEAFHFEVPEAAAIIKNHGDPRAIRGRKILVQPGQVPLSESIETTQSSPKWYRRKQDSTKEELAAELMLMQQKFFEAPGGIDDPLRKELWPILMDIFVQMNRIDQAWICWLQIAWRDEIGALPLETQSIEVLLQNSRPREVSWSRDFVLCLMKETNFSLINQVEVRKHLETCEEVLPIRAIWMVWLSIAQRSGQDSLLLSRVRDRLLTQLLMNGNQIDRDLPNFLASHSISTRESRLTTQAIEVLIEAATPWFPAAFADGFVGVFLGRLKMKASAMNAREKIRSRIDPGVKPRRKAKRRSAADEFHMESERWILAALDCRLQQAIDGENNWRPLSAELTDHLQLMTIEEKRWVDQYRRASKILAPTETIAPPSTARSAQGIEIDLELLRQEENPSAIYDITVRFLKQYTHPNSRLSILSIAIPQSFSLPPERVANLLQAYQDLMTQLGILDYPQLASFTKLTEESIAVAAHHGYTDLARRLLVAFHNRADTVNQPEILAWIIGSVNVSIFRLLSRLGLQREVTALSETFQTKLLKGATISQFLSKIKWNRSIYLPAILRIIGAELYFGNDTAVQDLRELRNEIFHPETQTPEFKLRLIRAFIEASSLAPEQEGVPLMLDFLQTFPKYQFREVEQLELAEKVLLCITSDSLISDPRVRRWLDEDEHIIRKRIHSDMTQFLQAGTT
jgi:hypothetical protein